MFRKTVVAVTAAALLGTAALTPAFAKPMGGGWGWHHFGGIGLGLGIAAGIAAAAAASQPASCVQVQYVQTPQGYLKPVYVNVC
jgi:hypothetical protein